MWKGVSFGKFPDLPCLWFSFEIPLCLIRMLSLFVTCGLFGNYSYHLILWLSWLSCPHPCINSVNANVEIYGGINIFMLLLAKTSNMVNSSSYIALLLIIVYKTLYLKNIVEVANPKFNKFHVCAIFGHGFCCLFTVRS